MLIKLSQHIKSILASRDYASDTPGIALLISKGNNILIEEYRGISDYFKSELISCNTRFNIASISKQFTATGILLLQEQGKLNIDDKIIKYLSYLDSSVFGDVSIRHIMSHTSGIIDARPRNDREWMLKVTDLQSIEYLKNLKTLRFTPGTNYDYVNPTYQILYKIIEIVSGMTFVDFQQKYIFNSIGMKDSFYFDASDTPTKYVARGYILKGAAESTDRDVIKETVYGNTSFVDSGQHTWVKHEYGDETFFATKADGGLYSTVIDLFKWYRALAKNSCINKLSVQEAFTPQVKVSGSKYCTYQNRPDTYYGLGFFIEKMPNDITKIYHTGDNGGFQAYSAYFPKTDVTVIALENRNDYDRWSFVKEIDKTLLNESLI